MEDDLLKKIAARKLIKRWQNGDSAKPKTIQHHNGSDVGDAISFDIRGNAGQNIVTKGDSNVTHHGNDFTNFGHIAGDVLTSGKKTTVSTNFGKAKINVTGGLHTGSGDITDSPGSAGQNRSNQSQNSTPSTVVVSTDFGEADINATKIHTGEGNIIITSESKVPKGFYFGDDPDFNIFKKNKTKKVAPQSNLEKIIDEWRYPIKVWGRNQALILNNWHFRDPSYNRMGADMDTNNLLNLLRDLGFVVTKKENLSKAQIIEEVKRFTTSSDIGLASVVLVFIGSHGAQLKNKDRFMDSCNEMVSVDDVIDLFTAKHAPMLLNIPKVFLFQFCRVLEEEYEVEDVAADDARSLEWFEKQIPTAADSNEVQRPHLLADMFIGCATVPGSAAFRHTQNGSWFVTTMKKVFQEKAHEEDMATLFMKVNDTVMKKKGNQDEKVQMCIYTSSLRKKIYFYPQ